MLAAACATEPVGVGKAEARLENAANAAPTELRLATLFSDGMVLQRECDAALWGEARGARTVTVRASWDAREVVATVDASSGKWSAVLRTPSAGGPHEVRVKANEREIVLKDVLVGEVWLCSGQSNMEMQVGPTSWSAGVLDCEKELAAAEFRTIREFDVPNEIALAPRTSCGGAWVNCSPRTAGSFSAVAYFFARELQKELKVPIGIVNATWGGTRVEAWMDAAHAARFEHVAGELKALGEERETADVQSARDAVWWKRLVDKDVGSNSDAWTAPKLDASAWKTVPLPGIWEQHGDADFDGVMWYRKSVELPSEWSGKAVTLELGAIDDMDTAWFDGVRIGGLETWGSWSTPRSYAVPHDLATAGRHTIAVRAVDFGGAGGFNGSAEQLVLRRIDAPNEVVSLAGEWMHQRGVALSELGPFPQPAGPHANSPTVLFNGMIAPLAPYTVRGFLWYQGESNRDTHALYTAMQSALIANWRALWHRDEAPFYFVQIAPFTYGGDRGETGALRDAQRRTLGVPHTGMAVTMDVGDPADIHPRNKQDVGKRLARLALANDYARKDVVACGPLFRSFERDGARLRVHFDNSDGGLISSADHLAGFEIAGADRKFVHPRAELDGECVLLWHPDIPEPVAVRYGFDDDAQTVLFNKSWLPAAAFRSDDWPLP